MNRFKNLFLAFVITFGMSACDSSQETQLKESESCPQCNMKLPASHLHTSMLTVNGDVNYFDDIGCMILWADKKGIELEKVEVKMFTNDTKKYLDAKNLFYSINETTPMHYGFAAYEHKQEGTITYHEVILRMLRGEHMANLKIRKHILGN